MPARVNSRHRPPLAVVAIADYRLIAAVLEESLSIVLLFGRHKAMRFAFNRPLSRADDLYHIF